VSLFMPVYCATAFSDVGQKQARLGARDVSKLVRILLRERYPDLPEE